jgi:inositol-phosphate phosphatase / L-galactose 1-phosphate phosphatase / histidinol-phosphatase
MTSLAPFVVFAQTLADEAATILRTHGGVSASTTVKPDKTFVTTLDLQIETQLRACINTAFPDHGIWGEEFDAVRPDARWVWTLDPIDGTMAFVAGMPVYSTLIGLCRDGVPVIGVMHFPGTGERWVLTR